MSKSDYLDILFKHFDKDNDEALSKTELKPDPASKSSKFISALYMDLLSGKFYYDDNGDGNI